MAGWRGRGGERVGAGRCGIALGTETAQRMGMFGGWDVVAVTAETGDEARAFQAELCQRRELGALPGVTKGTILLAVPDPHPRPEAPWDSKSTVVGSGGATLNAVLAVAEQLSARNGTGTLDATVLQSKRVVRHTGTNPF